MVLPGVSSIKSCALDRHRPAAALPEPSRERRTGDFRGIFADLRYDRPQHCASTAGPEIPMRADAEPGRLDDPR